MERIVLFGTGLFGRRTYDKLKKDEIKPLFFVDNNRNKWGSDLDGLMIHKPEELRETEFDAVVICVSDLLYESIYKQLTEELEVSQGRIRHWTYWQRNDFLDYYKGNDFFGSAEIKSIVDYVDNHDRLSAFNYPFTSNYDGIPECYLDEKTSLYYSFLNGKRLFLNKNYRTKEQAENYIKSLMIEQDVNSPHRYLDGSFSFDGGCVLDAGAAEGNFGLEVVERAKKLILVEADPTWNEALMRTFEPWKDKVTIINKYLSDTDGEETICINSIAAKQDIDFVKLDIEGAEIKALKGGRDYLHRTSQIKMAICAYHNPGDENEIRSVLEPLEFTVNATDGYMVFPDNMDNPPRLVRGVLRAEKNE